MSVCALYCVSTAIRRTPEFTQLDNVKSMLRKWPAKGMAGLHCQRVSSPSRVPLPPANTSASVSVANSLQQRFLELISQLRSQDPYLSLALHARGLRDGRLREGGHRRRRELAPLLVQPLAQRGDFGKCSVILRTHEVVTEAMWHNVLARQNEATGLHIAGSQRPAQE